MVSTAVVWLPAISCEAPRPQSEARSAPRRFTGLHAIHARDGGYALEAEYAHVHPSQVTAQRPPLSRRPRGNEKRRDATKRGSDRITHPLIGRDRLHDDPFK